jgi:prolipoprotein diacylglyceryltransferase
MNDLINNVYLNLRSFIPHVFSLPLAAYFFSLISLRSLLLRLLCAGKKLAEETNATDRTINSWTAAKKLKIVICARI